MSVAGLPARYLGKRSALGTVALILLLLLVYQYRLRSHPARPLNLGLHGCWEVEQPSNNTELVCSFDPLLDVAQQPIQILVRNATDAVLSVICDGCSSRPCVDASTTSGGSPLSKDHAGEENTSLLCRELRWTQADPHWAVLELRSRSTVLGRETIRLPRPLRTAAEDFQQRWRELGERFDAQISEAGGEAALLGRIQKEYADDLEKLRGEIIETQAERGDRRNASSVTDRNLHDRLAIIAAKVQNEWLRISAPDPARPSRSEEEVIDALVQASQLAKAHGWLRSQADLGEALAWRYRYRPRAVKNIQRLLDEPDWPRLLPLQNSSCVRLLLGAAVARQDVRLSDRYAKVAIAERLAMPVQNGRDDIQDLFAQSLLLAALSQSDEDFRNATQQLQIAAATAERTGDACLVGYLLGHIGWSRLLLLELGWPGDDPNPVLFDAIQRLSSSCPNANRTEVDNLWANVARAYTVGGLRSLEPQQEADPALVKKITDALAQVASANQTTPEHLAFDRQLVETRLHLLRGEHQPIPAELEQLTSLAAMHDSPLDGWLVTILYAEFFRLTSRLKPALQKFREADQSLLKLQRRVPVHHSYRTVLGRYRYASQRSIALALELGDNAQSMEILRQELQITHGLTLRPWNVDQASALVQQSRQKYEQHRRHFEERITHPTQLTLADCEELGQDKASWMDALDAIYQQQQPTAFSPPALQPGSLLIACTLLLSGSVCWGATETHTEVVQIAAQQITEQVLAEKVLPKLTPQIQRAEQILILAYGMLARLDIERVNFLGAPLGTIKPIRYTVDRPPRIPEQSSEKALLVLNPEGDLKELTIDAAGAQLHRGLKDWQVRLLSGSPMQSVPQPWLGGEALSSFVYSSLQASDLFLFFGHVDPMPCPTQTPLCTAHGDLLAPDPRLTALCLSQHTTLTTSDILAARRTPRRALLLGCASADRTLSSPEELIGLSQALAIRGTEVLAFARPILVSDAKEVLCGLGQAGLSGSDLGKLAMEIRARLYRGERCTARGHWYVPACPSVSAACPTPVDWASLRTYGP